MMFDILLILGLEIWPYVPYMHFPTARQCAEGHRVAKENHRQACEARDTWNSWHNRQTVEAAHRVERVWWAMWWVTWPRATVEQRHYWSEKVKELIGIGAWANADWPPP